jgi:GT2 family glycosyltransferase
MAVAACAARSAVEFTPVVPTHSADADQLAQVVRRLLAKLLTDRPGPVRVLALGVPGGPELGLWTGRPELLITRAVLGTVASDDILPLPPGRPWPFADRAFDVVVALEALRGGPADLLRELQRVASELVILSTPDDRPEVRRAEEFVGTLAQRLNCPLDPFLARVRTLPLPLADELHAHLARTWSAVARLPNAPLDAWIAEAVQPRDDAAPTGVRRWLNLTMSDIRTAAPAVYRHLYVAQRTGNRADLLRTITNVQPLGVQPTGDAFAEAVAGLFVALEQNRLANERGLRSVEEHSLIVQSFNQALTHSSTWAALAPVRWLRHWLGSKGCTAEHLIPWEQLRPLPAHSPEARHLYGLDATADVSALPGSVWRSTGDDPHFVVPCVLPAGWLRVRLYLRGPRAARSALYVDIGTGFDEKNLLEKFAWNEVLKDDLYVYLPRPARAIRLDPLDTPDVFLLEDFAITPLSPPAALWHALTHKLRLLRDYRCTGRTLFKGLHRLVTGNWSEVGRKVFKGLADSRRLQVDTYDEQLAYDYWRQRHALTDLDRQRHTANAASWSDAPLISVIMPVHNPDVAHLRAAIASVRRQTYPHWQLCICDDGSTVPGVRAELERALADEPRLRVCYRPTPGGISAASNDALALAEGQYYALLDHDDELAEHALYRVAETARANPQATMLYSDEDKLDPDGRHVSPFFKPQWAPEYFLSCMYTCHLSVFRADAVRAVGGFRSAFDLAQDYDLALRVVSAPEATVVHIPDVLYHWRKQPNSTAGGYTAKPAALQAARAALADHLDRSGRPGRVEAGPTEGFHRVRYSLRGTPTVSIVIPSACRPATLRGQETSYILNCIQSIRQRSTYRNLEIVVVDNADVAPELSRQLDALDIVHVSFTAPFNLSAKINLGATHASGEYILLLNDDIEVITPDWIESMLEYAQWPEIGAVGAKLLYPDGRLQHAGVTFLDGKPLHNHRGWPGNDPGYWFGNVSVRNCSAVTGACVLTRRATYHDVGGFPEALPLNFNDVEFCLKLRQRGLRIVYQPYAQLYHFESVSKPDDPPTEAETFLARWPDFPRPEPYYSPHLTKVHRDYRLDGLE